MSNDWKTDGQKLLEWQRGKAGTIELVHKVLKDDLAAGVYPSGKFGANAAWLRLQVITYNLMGTLEQTALDEKYKIAKPKRIRFAIFTQIGSLVRHARTTLSRARGPGGCARAGPVCHKRLLLLQWDLR